MDELTVKWFGDQRSDDGSAAPALQTLIWDVEVPDDDIDVKVSDGWVDAEG